MSIPYALDFTEDPAPEAWIAVPILEGRGADRQRRKWAKKCAELRWGLEPEGPSDKSQVKELARVLEGFSEQFPQRIPMQHLFAYAPDLRRDLVPFFFYAVDSQGPVEQVLDTLVQRNEPGAAQDPQIVDFTTDNLGKGLRSIRHFVPKGGEALCMSVNYGWRVDSHGIDLSMRTISDDLGWVSANIEAFDEFARNMKVVNPNDIAVD
ncbi:hypothetical protein [Streptomyces purpurogeneiscleroticus]|uniref:hypothetical protein n=1 Tax=Streptomyces purpurogeneiscleroticus TaxID=68259 RepID=UPI001CC0084D|nr:hypothetical protein [Streptomyces purpurogeneiscleroticus]MBZ4020016.1 hypothetical protein [Streptomyces purpurogeneiscleroticus]